MNSQSIQEHVIAIIANVLNIENSKISPEMKLAWQTGEHCLDINSYDYVRVIVEIESNFHITVDFNAVFDTVDDIIQYVIKTARCEEVI